MMQQITTALKSFGHLLSMLWIYVGWVAPALAFGYHEYGLGVCLLLIWVASLLWIPEEWLPSYYEDDED